MQTALRSMYCVLFEVQFEPANSDAYFKIAGSLRPELEKVEGFIHNERFASTSRPNTYISYSTWDSERSLVKWRTHAKHHYSQAKGRTEIFADYKIRIGARVADAAAPEDIAMIPHRFEETQRSDIKSVVLAEFDTAIARPQSASPQPTPQSREMFDSVVASDKSLELTGWSSEQQADSYLRGISQPALSGIIRARHFRIIRDYSLLDREEAPQYFPPVRKSSP